MFVNETEMREAGMKTAKTQDVDQAGPSVIGV